MTLPARSVPDPVPAAEVLPRVEIEVRQEPLAAAGFSGVGVDRRGRPIAGRAVREGDRAWRVYPKGEPAALTERGVLLGGRFDEACRDAERLARENGFHFVRPSELWLPG